MKENPQATDTPPPMRSAHRVLDVFHATAPATGRRIVFVSEKTPDRQKLYRWIPVHAIRQVCYQFLTSVDMALAVLRYPRPDLVFVSEHKPHYAAPLYLACLLRRLPVLFFVHGIQQVGARSPLHRAGFHLIHFLERHFPFWPIHLDLGDAVLPPSERFTKSLLISLPIPPRTGVARSPVAGRRVRVGVVGMLRGEKPIGPVLDRLLAFVANRPDYELVVGTPFWQLTDEVKNRPVTLHDTTSAEQYMALMESLDIVVAHFDRDSYYFRPSGVINDAVAAGCMVVAPDYPVFTAQLTTPGRVGRTYPELDRVGEAIELAAQDLRAGVPDFDAWRNFRSETKLVAEMAAHIRRVMETREGPGV